jgi:hypothetical protein
MFEHRSQPLLPPHLYVRRLARSALVGMGLVVPSLALGMIGYHVLENLDWIDAFLDSSMLLGGMGPVHTPVTDPGKLFAGLYAIFCGLVVILVAGIMIAPMVHRALHRFHLAQEDLEDDDNPGKPRPR